MTKFEQLLDYLVNEETQKANELFHEIVVEKSREIYENMISDDDEDDVEEGMADDHYGDDETTMEIGGDATDDFVDDVEDHDAMDDGEDDEFDDEKSDEFSPGELEGDGDTDDRLNDLESALDELKAEFEQLMAGEENEPEHADMFGDNDAGDTDVDTEDEFGDDEEGEDDTFGDDTFPPKKEESFRTESRRMTREYREKVADGHGADKKGKGEESGVNAKSPINTKAKAGMPTSDAKASNIAQSKHEGNHKPGVGGVLKKGGDFVPSGTQNVNGTKAKGYSEKSKGHGSEKKGSGETQVNDKPIVGGR